MRRGSIIYKRSAGEAAAKEPTATCEAKREEIVRVFVAYLLALRRSVKYREIE